MTKTNDLEANDLEALARISHPSRYLGGELGAISEEASQSANIRFALAFPDVYEVGMSHVGFPILYHILNQIDGVAAERAYAPWPDMEQELRKANTPLYALESSRPLKDFDIIGFTLQYELSYSNILNMLELSEIPLRREDRSDKDPLIVVGGPCAYNPEPLADFFDCAVIGDGEEAVADLCQALRESRSAGEDKNELLDRLSKIEGIYVPSLFEVNYLEDGRIEAIRPLKSGYGKVRRRFLKDLDKAPYPTRPIIPFMNTVHDRIAVEIARGCTRGCRFCQAGYIYRPVRERSPERIGAIIEEALENSGFEEVSLLSLSTGDYSCIAPLLQELMSRYAEEKVAISFPSLRVGSLTPELMEEIKKVRKTGFTLAPEAGTERMRQVINKGITEDDLLETTSNAFELGWRRVKLYFMLGLPTETDSDLEGIIDLSAKVKRSGKGTEGGADVGPSVSTFVPKPHTPFQWEEQIGIEETLRRQDLLRDGLKKKKLRLKWHDAKLSFMEGVFARGDRRLGRVLEKAVSLGCRFDGWQEHFSFDLWMQAFEETGIDPSQYLRQRTETETLPWDHIDCGSPKDYFLKERRNALAAEATPDCRTGACSNCGICNFKDLKMRHGEWEPPRLSKKNLSSAPTPGDEARFKIRLRVQKAGRARHVSHLEFMTVLHRAVRRAHVPVRFSQGFHPAPRISFPDALPVGVESDAEIIDIELHKPWTAEKLVGEINNQLPIGFKILEGTNVDWRTPSPTASIRETKYRVELGGQPRPELKEKIENFLAAENVPATRTKKGREINIDLRPGVLDMKLTEEGLHFTMTKGSPSVLASWLLGVSTEEIRNFKIRKVGILLSD